MHILYLTPYVPSPVRVRPYQLIRHLAENGHRVTLICLAGRDEEPAALACLRRWCYEVVTIPTSRAAALRNVVQAVPSGLALQTAYGASAQLVQAAQARLDRVDVVHVEHLRGSSYGSALRDVPLVLDAVDCISLLFERALRQSHGLAGRARALLDLARTRHAEGHYGQVYRQIVVTSAEDRWALEQLQAANISPPQIEVVPNGVDLEAFCPDPTTPRAPATVVLSGKMSYHANVAAALWLGREIMPLIWRERPDVRCEIVGRDPLPAIQALATDERICVTGAVPDVAPYLRQATVAVVPLRYGVGIQNKVLEALATATPVVATKQAAQALGVVADRDVLLAADAAGIAEQILGLLEQPSRRNALGSAGRRYVERHHTWQQSVRLLERSYAQAGACVAEREIAC